MMIGWEDIYKVVVGIVPLYLALILGYGSVKWWRMFTPQHCDAINSFVCYFSLPFFTFQFTSHVDPSNINYSFFGADAISKLVIVTVLVFWANCTPKGNYAWAVTIFSLSTFNNTLVVGVPLLGPMYGKKGEDLAVQSAVMQCVIWVPLLLFVLEFGHSRGNVVAAAGESDLEENESGDRRAPSFGSVMKVVLKKLVKNSNLWACILGLIWAFLSSRFRVEMPKIIEKSVLVMSNTGTGAAMFNMGLFMALQKKLIGCGVGLTILGMLLRFVGGPAVLAVGSAVVRLHGDVFKIAIIQAALPQSILSFVFAKEYGFHTDVISTAVIFGTVISLPVIIAYYAAFELIH